MKTLFYNSIELPAEVHIVSECFGIDITYEPMGDLDHPAWMSELFNLAKPGFESKHNITYWKNEEYIALGVGASGYINNIRYKNSASLTKYIKGIRDGVKEEVSQKDDIEYFLLCNLRLQEGFLLETFKNRYNIDILDLKKSEISDLINRKLIKIENNRLFCTDEGIMLLDFVLEKLF